MIPVEQFVEGLCQLNEEELTLLRVARYVEEHPVDPATLQPYLFYTNTHYTRNLIYKCALFELIVLCWDVGQGSRIHNHQNQNCWMAAPIGRLVVQNYDLIDAEDAGRCRLKEAARFTMDAAHPSYVDPNTPIHSVSNHAEFGERAASLHVYSRPYDRCRVYHRENNSYRDVPLFYDTEFGRPRSDREEML